MASLIKIKRNNTGGSVPGSLSAGELAINTFDKKLYSSDGTTVFAVSAEPALANTNLAIANVKTGLTSTNTALRLLISDRLQVANAVSLYVTKAGPTTSGLLAHTGRATISTNLTVSGNTVIGKLVANNSLGTAGYGLKSNGSTVYWDALAAQGTIVSLTTTSISNLTETDTVVTGGQAIAASAYLQVANAVATFTTKAYAAANSYVKTTLANTNSFIKSQLANTNTYIATKAPSANPTFTGTTGTQTLDGIFFINSQSVSVNYSIAANFNSMSVGPITVNSAVAVTVPSGSRWVVI
jgi:hypothetical protein